MKDRGQGGALGCLGDTKMMASEAVVIEAEEEMDAGNRVLAALCAASFLAALNYFATTPFYPEIAHDLHATVPLVGQVATAMILISATLGLAVGPLADRYGYRGPLTLGVLAVAANLIGVGLAPSYPVMLGLSIAGGLADALVFGLPLAIAGLRYSGAAQKRAMGWTIGSLSSASIVGVPVMTAIGGATGWRIALIGAGSLAAVSAWLIALALPPDDPRPASRFRWAELWTAYAPLLRHGPVLRLYGASALRSVTWFGVLTYLGAFLDDRVGLGTERIGLMYTACGIGAGAGSFLGGRLRLRSPRRAVALTCAGSGIGVGAVLLQTSAWVVAPLVLALAFAGALAGLAIATLLADESPAGIGTTMVLNGSTINLGAAGGAALGGALIALGGYPLFALGAPLFAFAAAVLALWPAGGGQQAVARG